MIRPLPPLVMALALALGGCASRPESKPPAAPPPGPLKTMQDSPLSDLNIGGGDIPDVLLRAVNDTYLKPTPLNCETLGAEVLALDRVLGPDLDTLKAADKPDEFAKTALVNAIRGLVPYSGVLRLITGAKARQRRIAEAIAAGGVRRGYLKGLGESFGCDVPAAPLHRAPEAPPPPANPPQPDAASISTRASASGVERSTDGLTCMVSAPVTGCGGGRATSWRRARSAIATASTPSTAMK